ncbi:MAG TPA: acyl-CoA dehydrogenase family protein [Candidatus Binataceae bacterium]|nr:acyl-CoA dehydrogenase family protein [Candidatus Binataceae bacterium]
MDFGLNEEQRHLTNSAREFMRNECPTTVVRKAMADADGMPREVYRKIAQLGWTGLIVPEEFGGAGLGMLDMALLLAECGHSAMPGPFLFSSTLAASALILGGTDELKRRWLPALADGSAIGTIAITEEGDSLSPDAIATSVREDSAGHVLNGVKMFVPYANVADFIIVAARSGSGADDFGFWLIERAAPGLSVETLRNLDQTRRVSRISLDNVTVPAHSRLEGRTQLLDRLIDIGAVAIAADSLGGSERALDMAVEYSKIREQFGRPIGSFQALKHAAAEIVADLEPARSLLWYAAHALDAQPNDASRAAAMAKARLSDIYTRATGRSVLMHGGIGFTWDHDIHLWFKRARFNESFFGSPVFHRERLARLSGY